MTTAAAKRRIRRLIARFDALADAYADALIRGQDGWARRREQNLKRLGRQVRDLTRGHELTQWTRSRLAAK